MTVIGVTGTIGSGKSTVCGILSELGCTTLDADKIAHQTYRRGTRVWQSIIDHFGPQVQKPDGAIDRRRLGQIVFADLQARTWLNSLVHPAARKIVEGRLKKLKRQGVRCAAVEATLLIEAGWADLVDELWLIVASEDTVIRRLEKDRNQPAESTRSRLSAQTPAEEHLPHVDAVLYNDGNLKTLRSQVEQHLERLRNR